MILVDLVVRYSNYPELRISPATLAEGPGRGGQPRQSGNHGAVIRVHKLERRLDASTIARLVAEYEAGVPTTRLTERYGLGKGTVLSVLRQHGVKVRRQGLSPTEIDEAMALYMAGWSLARIGAQFGRAHTVIRKALLDRGVKMRSPHGH